MHDDSGLHAHLARWNRRDLLRGALSLSALALAGCGPAYAGRTCPTALAEETAGPFPGRNALATSGIVRSDLRASVGSAVGVAEGVLLRVKLTLVDVACAPLAGRAIYAWHCDRAGRYSMYSDGVVDENYLRGVQATNADGAVEFTTVFPGAYSGRWPHIHFEVFDDLAAATHGRAATTTSQLALPQRACEAVYAQPGYDGSARILARSSLSTDGVFRDDGAATQLAETTGSVAAGYVAELLARVG